MGYEKWPRRTNHPQAQSKHGAKQRNIITYAARDGQGIPAHEARRASRCLMFTAVEPTCARHPTLPRPGVGGWRGRHGQISNNPYTWSGHPESDGEGPIPHACQNEHIRGHAEPNGTTSFLSRKYLPEPAKTAREILINNTPNHESRQHNMKPPLSLPAAVTYPQRGRSRRVGWHTA